MKRSVVCVGVLFFLVSPCFGQDPISAQRATLKGLRRATVIVTITTPGNQGITGISEEQLKTIIELELRKSGISVVSVDDDVNWDKKSALLFLNMTGGNLTVIPGSGQEQVWHMALTCLQSVSLTRDPRLRCVAPTSGHGVCVGLFSPGSPMLIEQIHQAARNCATQFANDFLAENPK